MSKAQSYEEVIKAGLDILQKRKEIKDLSKVIESNLTYQEYTCTDYLDEEDVERAVLFLKKEGLFEVQEHELATVKYKDIDFYVHKNDKFDRRSFNRFLLKYLMKELKSK